jgi:hypothetical protein
LIMIISEQAPLTLEYSTRLIWTFAVLHCCDL